MVARAVAVLFDDPRVLAGWLVGSFATGTADAFSDVDLHCLGLDDALDELRESWRDIAHAIAPMVLLRPFTGAVGGACITRDWLHLDLVLHPRSSLDPKAIAGMRPLFDKVGGLVPPAPTPRKAPDSAPYFPSDVVDWFFYMLGNLPVVVGRNEPAWAMTASSCCATTALCRSCSPSEASARSAATSG